MFRILIIDDDYEKIRKISNSLQDVEGIDLNSICNVVDARSAKLKLKLTYYDLLVLDIAIPARINEEVRKNAGIELLMELLERDEYKIPADIICVTAFEKIFSEENDLLSQNLINFLFCDPTSDKWVDQIKAKVSRLVAAKHYRRFSSGDYESFLAIVCALETPELHAILNNGWQWEKINTDNDATTYYRSRINLADSTHSCYAAAAPRKGMPAAAVLATKMISSFTPKYLVMPGITSGYKDKTRVGDIIVINPVWDWGSGKLIKRDSEIIFEPESNQLDLDIEIRNKLKLMAQDNQTLSHIRRNWQAKPPEHELSMIIGPLASGSVVLADHDTHERILKQHRGLLGIDMEAYSVFAAAQEAFIPRPTVFAMKSVADFADGEKNDRYQNYAAYTSSQAVKFFVENYLISI